MTIKASKRYRKNRYHNAHRRYSEDGEEISRSHLSELKRRADELEEDELEEEYGYLFNRGGYSRQRE